MTARSVARQAVPLATRSLLKFSMAILVVGPTTFQPRWPLYLFARLTIQFLRLLPESLPIANPWQPIYELPWRILAAAINFFAN
jgi:hypothetical protein